MKLIADTSDSARNPYYYGGTFPSTNTVLKHPGITILDKSANKLIWELS